MVSISNEWKLDPKCKAEIYSFTEKESINTLDKAISEKMAEFMNENYHWVQEGILEEKEFLAEKKARESLLETISFYAQTCERFTKNFKENYFFLLDETLKKIRNELNAVENDIFGFQHDGKKLSKRKGESMEHYLMRGFILQHLDEKYGIRDFHEEYSKLKEVLRNLLEGKANEKEWNKIAKRGDLYVILNDGARLWVEIERTTNSSELSKKLKRIKTMMSLFPKLIDKVVFVFSNLLGGAMVEGTLIEARKIRFPTKKLEFYEVNLREAQLVHVLKPKLVKTEFKDRMLDGIADGSLKPTGKTAMIAKDRIREKIILPLTANKFQQEWVKNRKDKIKRLIHFWRIHTRKFFVSEEEIKFKEKALIKMRQNYLFLLNKK